MSSQSEQINELAEALSIVQATIRGYREDSANPFFKSKYGDLTSVWAAVREPLTTNGLAVVQTMGDTANGDIRVTTTLLHKSGQWIRGTITLTPDKPGPQAAGSAITYARRYSLAAIVGIAPEDDDAEGATNREQPSRQEKQKAAQKKADEQSKSPITDLYIKAKEKGMTESDWKDALEKTGIKKDKRTHTKERIENLEIRINSFHPIETPISESTPFPGDEPVPATTDDVMDVYELVKKKMDVPNMTEFFKTATFLLGNEVKRAEDFSRDDTQRLREIIYEKYGDASRQEELVS